MARLSRIRIHPIKSLDAIEVSSEVVRDGGLEWDRKYAIFDESGDYVNAKRNRDVHRIRLDFDTEAAAATVWVPGARDRRTFHMAADRPALERWLSDFLGEPVTVEESIDTRYTDAAGGLGASWMQAPGPSIVSTRTFEEIASWFPELELEEVRQRFRTNLEIEGVPPFWEDRLFSDRKHVVVFRIGDVRLHGIMPLPRCAVPARNPESGERHEDFVEKFVEKRKAHFPEWNDSERLGDHLPGKSQNYYYLTVVTRIPNSMNGSALQVGDELNIQGEERLVKSH